MPDISPTRDGTLASDSNAIGAWVASRDASTATYAYFTQASTSMAVRARNRSGRGGGEVATCARAIFGFDTSGISVAPTEATLHIATSYVLNSEGLFIVKSTADDSPDASDFDSMTGWNGGSVDEEGNVTKYSAELTSFAANGNFNHFALNSTALSDMASLDYFSIFIIDSVYDLRNTVPDISVNYDAGLGMYFSEGTTSKRPYLEYTAGTAAAVTDNAVFFGANF